MLNVSLHRQRGIFRTILLSSAVVSSTHVTWAPKTRVQRQEREQKTCPRPLGRMYPQSSRSFTSHIRSSYHVDLNMDTVVTAVRSLFAVVTGFSPKFRSQGGSAAEN